MPDAPLLAMSDRQDLYSMAYVQAVVAAAGFNYSAPARDRSSADLYIDHGVENGFTPTYPRLVVQVKCTYVHTFGADGLLRFPLRVRNYDHLRMDHIEPRILVVVLVPRPESSEDPWLECVERHTVLRWRAYWTCLVGREPVANSETVTVAVPAANAFDISAVRHLMDNMVARGNKKP